MMKVTALVPMRHDSERVKGKNYRPLQGAPLYHHIVRALLDATSVERVVIDTDSGFIAADAAQAFPTVDVVERPADLRAGDIAMNDVLAHTTAIVEADWYLQTHSTNPFLRPETIDAAVAALAGSLEWHDSLFSVTRIQARLWRPDGTAVNHDPAVLLRTQDLPPIFEENSNLYLFQRETLMRRRNRIGARPLMFEIPRDEAWDIDDETDFTIATALTPRLGSRA